MKANLLAWLRYELRTFLANYPFPYLTLATRLKPRANNAARVEQGTDLVIQAYPRSANTYAYHAFQVANEQQNLKIAHHLHAPAQVILGAELGVPVLVIFRNPEDSVCSFVMRHPEVGIRQALRSWLRFHRKVMTVRSAVYLASFIQITSDYADVIEGVNKRYGTQFTPYRKNEENEKKIRSRILKSEPLRDESGRPSDMAVALPTHERSSRKDAVLEEIRRHRELLSRCNALYAQMCAATRRQAVVA